ncbi:MAG: glycosyltransferase [Bryobacteraceae bacterium]
MRTLAEERIATLGQSVRRGSAWRPPLMLYGVLAAAFGFGLYTCGIVWVTVRFLVEGGSAKALQSPILYLSGIPVLWGGVLIAAELMLQLPGKRAHRRVAVNPPVNPRLTVVLTAYNDESSIAAAVSDFRGHPLVERVLVVDNHSADGTREAAARAGATVIREDARGYGHCVYRALAEAARYTDTELVLLCEGDMTFRAYDIDKFLAYAPHAEIVNGTRIVEQLRDRDTQLSTFIYYGNFAVGKLLELKHIGRGTFTDVGTTYKLCRTRAVERLLPRLDARVNLEFNAHFLDKALETGIDVVECPITFFARVGRSKGGNVSNARAMKVGLRMIAGLLVGWRVLARG